MAGTTIFRITQAATEMNPYGNTEYGRRGYRRCAKTRLISFSFFFFVFSFRISSPCPTYSCFLGSLFFPYICPLKILQKAIIMFACVGWGHTAPSTQQFGLHICKILVCYNDTFFAADTYSVVREQERWSKTWT